MLCTLTLQDIFDHVLEMPSISKVVQELIASFNDPKVKGEDIANKLRLDPAMSAKVLRLANSARYGAGRRVATIDAAVVTLGFDALRTLVVASGVTGAFRQVPHMDMAAYWRETFLVASVCKMIAQHAHLDAETAFTCGLMHRVGDVLLMLSDAERMRRIHQLTQEGANEVDLERNQFGFDYGQVGEELAKRWNFPDVITHAIGQHTHVTDTADAEAYARVIYLARYLVLAHLRHDSKHDILAHFPNDIASALDLDLVSLMEAIDRLMAEEDDIDQVLAA